jgi:predicted metal-dependent phosphoesterase TrpH
MGRGVERVIVDLHNHAELSLHTEVTIDDYVRGARHIHVSVGITEHNRLAPKSGVIDGVLILPGIEILNDYGDFLVFGAPEDCLARRDMFELVDYVHDYGGVIIAAHPFSGYGVCKAVDSKTAGQIISLMDAVEVWNGRAGRDSWRQAEHMASAYKKPGTGGSDAHHLNEMFQVGTRFMDKIESVNDLITAIRAGRCEPVILDNQG